MKPEIAYIMMSVPAGAEISRCALEDAKLCLEQETKVCFVHNDRHFSISHNDIVKLIFESQKVPDQSPQLGDPPITWTEKVVDE